MNLEQQVVSLDLAKRLKELGVKQESQFYWMCEEEVEVDGEVERDFYVQYVKTNRKTEEATIGCSAFTVAELGEMLPNGSVARHPEPRKLYDGNKTGNQWVYYLAGSLDYFKADTEADARAQMLIYLLENGLLKLEQEAA